MTTREARRALYASHDQDQFTEDMYEHIQRFNRTLIQIDDCFDSESDVITISDESDSESADEDKSADESSPPRKRFRPDQADHKVTSW